MSTIIITEDEQSEIMETIDSIKTGTWRWGSTETYVFERAGKHYIYTARFHCEEGWERVGDAKCREVKPQPRTIIEWVPVTE